MLTKRVATAAVLLPLVIGSILWSGKQPLGWPFLLLCGAAAALCAYELFRMFAWEGRDLAAGVALAALVYLSATVLPAALSLPAVLLFAVLAVLHPLPGADDIGAKTLRAAMLVLGAVYAGGLPAMYPMTLALPRGEHWVLLGILTVSAGDTLAYFTGRTLGRRKLAPALSPNKTVEGAAGGLAGSVACSVLYAHWLLPGVPAWYVALAGAAVGAFGQGGDLFESLLKRAAGVKDSGTALPGHGGILDRVDGMLAAAPVLYLAAAFASLVESWS
ncbi:MAG: phosphatidate cytidylyltransferase [Thermodesulfobacteriota bacterium]